MLPQLTRKGHRFYILGCAIAVFAGCGGSEQVLKDRARVSGTITYNGQPLKAGTISFRAADGPVATPASIYNGTYTTRRAPIGKTFVTIDTSSIKYGNPASFVPIPAKYKDSATSGLTAEIQPGENENVDFSLE